MGCKTRYLKKKFNKKGSWNNINQKNVNILVIIEQADILFKVQKRYRACRFKNDKNKK